MTKTDNKSGRGRWGCNLRKLEIRTRLLKLISVCATSRTDNRHLEKARRVGNAGWIKTRERILRLLKNRSRFLVASSRFASFPVFFF